MKRSKQSAVRQTCNDEQSRESLYEIEKMGNKINIKPCFFLFPNMTSFVVRQVFFSPASLPFFPPLDTHTVLLLCDMWKWLWGDLFFNYIIQIYIYIYIYIHLACEQECMIEQGREWNMTSE